MQFCCKQGLKTVIWIAYWQLYPEWPCCDDFSHSKWRAPKFKGRLKGETLWVGQGVFLLQTKLGLIATVYAKHLIRLWPKYDNESW